MSSLTLLCCLIGIGWAIWWTVENDDVPLTGKLRGLFALRDPTQKDEESPSPAASRRSARGRHRPNRRGALRKAS